MLRSEKHVEVKHYTVAYWMFEMPQLNSCNLQQQKTYGIRALRLHVS